MKLRLHLFALILLCGAPLSSAADFAAYVNPFIGTTKDGTTYPGAVAPFGMLQWSPDTGQRIGGYEYNDTHIRGFSVYRVSGTGGIHGQDLPFMPTVGPLDRSPVGQKDAYASRFSHEKETAAPGNYQVVLEDSGVVVDTTVTTRSGIGLFRYPASEEAAMILHPTGRAEPLYNAQIAIDPAQRKISGYSFGTGAINGYSVYFVAYFDRDFSSYGFWKNATRLDGIKELEGKDIATFVRFDTRNQSDVRMRFAVSYVSLANAEENLAAEIPGWDVEAVKAATRNDWNNLLGRIDVSGGTLAQRRMFYTSLYHASLHPNIFNDVNGQYMDMDDKVQTMEKGRNKYVNYSLWDVYRTIPQLQALLQPAVTSDMVNSLLLDSQQCQGGGLPIFGALNSAPGIMCGYPADPFMASAYAFGARDFDAVAVHKKMVETAMNQMPCGPSGGAWWHMDDYKRGYVAHESSEWGSISYNIEYAVADFSVAMMSAAVGDLTQYAYFMKRAQNWENLFNPRQGYMQERYRDGNWVPRFTPTNPEGFMEGNAVQQSLMVPHNIGGVLRMTQNHHPIEPQLDHFFSTILTSGWPTDQPFYWAGNEPMIGMPWYYNWLQKPWKTQDIVRRILDEAYQDAPDGLPGNDDLGTMSAWYVFASLGLYPEIPGVAGFSLNAPLFPAARINFGNGKTLAIRRSDTADARYIQKVLVNDRLHDSTWLSLDDLMSNTHNTLDYELGAVPDTSWGTAPEAAPPSFNAKGPYQQKVHGMDRSGIISSSGNGKAAIDRNLHSIWKNSGRQAFLQQEFPEALLINAYAISSSRVSGRDPRAWRFLGSLDGITWELLDQRQDVAFTERLQTQSFAFTNCGPFRFYRIEFAGEPSPLEIGEWALHTRPTPLQSDGITVGVEAETGVMQGLSFATSLWGYTGTGYAAAQTDAPVRLELNAQVPKDGAYHLRLRYAVTSGDRSFQLTVNDQPAGSFPLIKTWHYREADGGIHNLKTGPNTIVIQGSMRDVNLDGILLMAEPATLLDTQRLILDAESGIRSETHTGKDRMGFWGKGYVNGFEEEGRSLRLPFCVPAAGTYQLSLRYASPYGDKTNSISISGSPYRQLAFPESQAFRELDSGAVSLKKGRNTLTISKEADDWGWIDLDAAVLDFKNPVQP